MARPQLGKQGISRIIFSSFARNFASSVRMNSLRVAVRSPSKNPLICSAQSLGLE
jgi:hypothetical protein